MKQEKQDSYNQHIEMFKLLSEQGDGVLSTISVDIPGYPFGSVTPYCLDKNFRPNILISTIAQHTKNINANSKVSLTIIEQNPLTNKQAKGRLTFVGDCKLVEEDKEIKTRYLSYFPNAKDYFGTHDFKFYYIEPERIRFIGGFGKIYWIEKDQFKFQNIFESEVELGIVNHMNEDHEYNLRDYSRHYLGNALTDSDKIKMTGLDQYGLDLSINEIKQRIHFEQPIKDAKDARAKMVEMAKASKLP